MKGLKGCCLWMVICVLICLGMAYAENEISPQQLVRNIIYSYGNTGSAVSTSRDSMLAELNAISPVMHDKWEKIVQCWISLDSELMIRTEVLPDGLPDSNELCIVVLGFHLNADGTMRDELIGRLRVALASAYRYPHAYVACTGGPTASRNADASEAGRMAEWLMENGISRERIIVEDQSLTTGQNAIYTMDILSSTYPEIKQLAIVTSDYHIRTGILVFAAESILRAKGHQAPHATVVAHAAFPAPLNSLSRSFDASALAELSRHAETEWELYYGEENVSDSLGLFQKPFE